MKKLLRDVLVIIFITLAFIGASVQKANAQQVSYQAFYDNLSPYGQWVSDPQYGNVWIPNEGGDFRPYGTNGHWVMTDYGNTWVSDDPWGWACYHYGRWTYDPYYGWVWIPGYEWAPAWVSWRFGGGYCGWAPLGPGVSIGASYNCPDSWWVFVGPQYMYQPNCIHYWRGPGYNGTYIRQAPFITNAYVDNGTHVRYNFGPRADAIQQVTHQPVQVYHVSQGGRAGAPSMSGNKITMYRPTVNQATASTARPANVIAAPRQIGRPQAATNTSPAKQPAFHQQLQAGTLKQGNAGAAAHANPANTQQHANRGAVNNNQAGATRQQNAHNTQPQAAQHNQQQHINRQAQARPQSAPQQRQQSRPQPMQQQRQQPVQQSRQQPVQQQRQQPMPQQHMEAPRQAAPPPREEEGGRR